MKMSISKSIKALFKENVVKIWISKLSPNNETKTFIKKKFSKSIKSLFKIPLKY